MQSMPVPEVFSHSLRDPIFTPQGVARAELPSSVLKHLRPLGHEVVLFQAAAEHLLTRLGKGRFEASLAEQLRLWYPKTIPSKNDEEHFTLLVTEGRYGWQIMASSLDWLNDPAWAALLHLPALRTFWSAYVRGSHLDHLRQTLPQAWFMDDTPLPPGCVISGLGIASWAELPRLDQQGRGFIIQNPPIDMDQAQKRNGAILTEPPSGQHHILARYHHGAEGIRLDAAWSAEGAEALQVFSL
jgi:hypothetical protein